MESIIQDNVLVCAHCTTNFGVKLNLWDKVGKSPNLGNIRDIIFKGTSDYGHNPMKGAVKNFLKSESKTIEGIYEFVAESGKTYVGQSKDILKRLMQHIDSGKLPEGAQVIVKEVLGGKTTREVAEQLRIRDLGGVDNLDNIRNPIGPARQHLMP
ncbi:hypothetical protein [Kaistella sp.]|uniref:hypothetical protein n=1 Tax=Kaistella sp. TaxID=2782235 RepID=UPI003C360B2C